MARVSDWAGKHVIVTGGSEGIGAAVAGAFAQRGAQVSIIARRKLPLRDAAKHLGADWAAADVTRADQLGSAITELEQRNGPCEVIACCAGLALPGRLLEVDAEEFETQMSANHLGAVHAVRRVLPGMIERSRGKSFSSARPRRSSVFPVTPATGRPRRASGSWHCACATRSNRGAWTSR